MKLDQEIINTKIYNYLDEETNDVINYINDNLDLQTIIALSAKDPDEVNGLLVNLLDDEDAVTGNASHSYTFSEAKAERCLYGNWDLLKEAVSTISPDLKTTDYTPEEYDVLIRSYLLSDAVHNAIAKFTDKQ